MKYRVGVAGYGLSGKNFHIPLLKSLSQDYEIRAVAAGKRVREASSDLPDTIVVASAEELFRVPDLDLVVIATPSGLHAAHARAALEAGLHVVLEKPFATTLSEADGLIETAHRKGRILTIFHNRRYDADFRFVRHIIERGELGAAYEAEFRWDRFRPQVRDRWKERPGPGSGLLWDLSPHLFDQANILFGPFDWIWANTETQRDGAGADDWFHVVLGRGKVRVILHAGSMAPHAGFHYRIHGETGTFLSYGEDSQEWLLRSGERPGCTGWGTLPKPAVLFRPDGSEERSEPAGGDWRDFYRALAPALGGMGPVPVDALEARGVLALMAAARASSENGRRVDLESAFRGA